MGFENIIPLQFFRTVFEDGLEFIPGFFYGRLEAFDLTLKLLIFEKIFFDNLYAFLINQLGLADADTGRGIDSFKYFFLSNRL